MISGAVAALDRHRPAVVAIGASAGAIDTLAEILPLLPACFPAPVVVVVHVPAARSHTLADLFVRMCPLSTADAVIEAAPIEGFEHQVTTLDTLGTDQPEFVCK